VANTIRIRRSTTTAAPTTLANAELAYSESSSKLFIGVGTGGAGGSATSIIAIGGTGAYATLDTAQTITGNKTFTGTVDLSGATVNGNTTFQNSLTVTGNLTVSGTTTTVNSTTVDVADKNLTLGNVGSPTNTTANGGGITLKGATDKTFNWVSSTSAWTSSEHLDLASGKAFYINGTSVLSGTTLGSGVTGSSLTSVGTLSSGSLGTGFTTVAVAQGGTGATTLTGLVKGNGTSAFTAAVAGTDYLSPSSDIDGGVF
jgi:hypothetical protein